MMYAYNSNLFDSKSQEHIKSLIEVEIDKEIFDIITKTNNRKPIFTANHLWQVVLGKAACHNTEQIKMYIKLNKKGFPIFDPEQMAAIRCGINAGLTNEEINIYARIKNDYPRFGPSRMHELKNLICKMSKEYVKQLKECIDEDISLNALYIFLSTDRPVEEIRVYRSLCVLGLGNDELEQMVKDNPTYEELKNVKYITQCAKELNCFDNVVKNIYGIDDFKNNLIEEIAVSRTLMDPEAKAVIEKCLLYKMPPEHIDFLTNKDDMFDYGDLEYVAIGLLNGLTPEEIKEAVDNGGTLEISEIIDNAIRWKFGNVSNIDEDVKIKTDWFDELER